MKSIDYSQDVLTAAHHYCRGNRRELEGSAPCGCFYCLEIFSPAEITIWLSELGGTALCPHCSIDSVIGSASGYPIDDRAFLEAMHKYWFE